VRGGGRTCPCTVKSPSQKRSPVRSSELGPSEGPSRRRTISYLVAADSVRLPFDFEAEAVIKLSPVRNYVIRSSYFVGIIFEGLDVDFVNTLWARAYLNPNSD